MPVHDVYARVTPFELLLPDEEFAGRWFPLIREEAEEKGGSLDTPESFILLSQAAMALREIRGEEDGPDLIQQHGALLYHAFHFWEAGEPLYFVETGAARFLVEHEPQAEEWVPPVPETAGYIQLPQHLFWSAGEEGDVPESLDGIFWAVPDHENITVLVAMGIRKDRPGLAVVPLPTLPVSAAAPWATMKVRPDGDDFRSLLPGAELEGLYSVAAGGEALKLVMRTFWFLDAFPERVEEMDGGTREGGEPGAPQEGDGEPAGEAESDPPSSADGPEASRLSYRRLGMETDRPGMQGG